MLKQKTINNFHYLELTVIFIVFQLIEINLGALLDNWDFSLFISSILVILFFIFKLKNPKRFFKNEVDSFFTKKYLYDSLKIGILILFVSWSINILYLYSGVLGYLFSNHLTGLSIISYIYPYLCWISQDLFGIFTLTVPADVNHLFLSLNLTLIVISQVLFFIGLLFNKLKENLNIFQATVVTALMYVMFSGVSFGSLLILFFIIIVLIAEYCKTKSIFAVIFTFSLYTFLDNLIAVNHINHLNIYTAFGFTIICIGIISLIHLYKNFRGIFNE